MKFAPHSLIPALFGLALMPLSPVRAEEQHHQPDSATAAPSATTPAEQPAAAPSMPMMNMMNMMGQQPQGMPMMNMMGQGGMGMMGMMGQGAMPGTMPMAGMPMQGLGAHLEGRIAFLRAELAITESQAPQWEAFAQGLRDSTAKLKQAQAAAQPAAATFLQRADIQEQWLSARLEGLREVRTAFAGLQAVLSEDQKKTAEALLTRPVCLGQMGMM
jgi:hypothetical protein